MRMKSACSPERASYLRLAILHVLVPFVLLAGANASYAESRVVNCDGCNSARKRAAASAETQNGRVYVTDRTNDVIFAYDVATFPELHPPPTLAILTSTPSHIATYFNNLIGQYHIATAPNSGVPIPAQIAGSAHDLVGNGQLQVEVGLWLLGVFFESPTIDGERDGELEEIRDKVLDGKPVKAEFTDGSVAGFTLVDFAVGDAEFDLLDNSLRDAQFNPIPDSPSDVRPGDFGSFSSSGPGGLGTRDDFVDTLTLLGIDVSGDLSGSGACSTFTCSSTSGAVECVFTVGSC